MTPRWRCGLMAVAAFMLTALLSTSLSAQTGGTVAGQVKDTSGAVLPGVTVEASSPVLIERVRTGVTDAQGQYKIIDLRPGVYTVKFSLAGFNTLVREGLDLSAGVAITVDVELKVGSLEESITVSGEAPIVDVVNTTSHRTFTTALMDVLPASRNVALVTALIPGARFGGVGAAQDVGGTRDGENLTATFHGSKAGDMPMMWDGMKLSAVWGSNGGSSNSWNANPAMVEEYSIDLSGAGAEAETSGVRANQVPKQGGNRFSGSFFTAYSNHDLQADNLDASLTNRQLTTSTQTRSIWNVNGAVGGPIKRDKAWFFFALADWGSKDLAPGSYFSIDPKAFAYSPDLTRPAEGQILNKTANVRLTWQLSSQSKLSLYGDTGASYIYRRDAQHTEEATTERVTPLNHVYQARWDWTASSRVLVQAGFLYKPELSRIVGFPEAAADGIGIRDTGLGVYYRAPTPTALQGGQNQDWNTHNYYSQASVSYVPGSHNMKVGLQVLHGDRIRMNNGDTAYTLTNGVPNLVTYTTNAPTHGYEGGRDVVKLNLGLYAQDQWTIRKLTLNLGLRFDYLNGYRPDQQISARKWVGARSFAGQQDLPNWKDISPRLGVSYDLFGDGKTALKWNLNRFVEGAGVGISEAVNPVLSDDNALTTRAWDDRTACAGGVPNDFVPQECELRASSNTNFGSSFINTSYAPDVVTGWGTRGYNWETMVGIQRELRRGLSVDVGYFHRSFGNFRVTQNVATTPADYDEFCVTSPVDSRLPGGGGQLICGLYNIKQTRADGTPLFGVSKNVIKNASDFGKQFEKFDSVDINVIARVRGGLTLQGGTSTGRTHTNADRTVASNIVSCFVVNSPGELRFCDKNPPFQTQIKLVGSYPLPWFGLQASGTYQSLPGPEITASWSAPVTGATSVLSGINRPLSGGVRNVTVALIQPGTQFDTRFHEVDFRLIKNMNIRGVRVQPQFDLYNLLNGNAVLALNTTYGGNWLKPTTVLTGRMAKFGVQLNF